MFNDVLLEQAYMRNKDIIDHKLSVLNGMIQDINLLESQLTSLRIPINYVGYIYNGIGLIIKCAPTATNCLSMCYVMQTEESAIINEPVTDDNYIKRAEILMKYHFTPLSDLNTEDLDIIFKFLPHFYQNCLNTLK